MQISNTLAQQLLSWYNDASGSKTSTTNANLLVNSSLSDWWSTTSSNSSSSDVFDLSPQFSLIQQQYEQLSQQVQLSATLQEIQNSADAKVDAFGEDLVKALKDAGIELDDNTTLNLTMDDDGMVRVMGDHPQKEAIEAFFTNSAEWSERYADCHMFSEMLHSITQQMSVSQSSNPYLKNKSDWDYTVMSVESDGVAAIRFL